jgi:hypothetical protein
LLAADVFEGDAGCAGVFVNATRAASKCVGNALPRLSARRSIPAAALGESEYFCGAASWRMSLREGWEQGEDKHPTSSLRNPVLGVDNPPCKVHCPAFGQRIENRPEVSTTSCAEETGDILE